jgi:hypothetical protein
MGVLVMASGLAAGIALAFALAASGVRAQADQIASASSATTADACELHVWAGPDYFTDISGLFPQGSLAGSIGTAGARSALQPNGHDVIATWLSPEFIGRTVQSADLAALMGRPVSVIVHPTTRREVGHIMGARTRNAPSTAHCYHELYVRRVFLQRALFYGTRMFVAWRLKTFAADGVRPRVVTGAAMLQLPGFRVDRPPEEMRADLEDGVRRSFDAFMQRALSRPMN